MRYRVLVLAVFTGLGVASCGENTPPAHNGAGGLANDSKPAPVALVPTPPDVPAAAAPQIAPTAGRVTPPTRSAGSTANVASFAKPSVPVVSEDPIPAADAEWTIFCYSVGGVTHVEDARNLKAALIQKTNRREWYVIHGRDQSHLYFGYYRTIREPKNGKDQQEIARARADKDLVAEIEDSKLDKPFRMSAFVQLSAPDPTSRPEWNLANVDLSKEPKDPTRAYWSIQVAAFRDHPKRKEAAVQAVEALRQNGVDAFYYHGESISSVCVGAWPPGAVREFMAEPEMKDTAGIDPRKADRLVVTSDPLHPNLIPRQVEGEKVTAVAPQLDILDRAMLAMTKRFPTHQVNYEETIRRGKNGEKIPESSFLVVIPRAKGNGRYDDDDVAPVPPYAGGRVQDVPAAFVNPTAPGGPSGRQFGALSGQSLDGATLGGARVGDPSPAVGVRQPAAVPRPAPAAPAPAAPAAPVPPAPLPPADTAAAQRPGTQPPPPPPVVPGAGRLRRVGDK